MFARHIRIILALTLIASVGLAADTREVKLSGGKTLTGVLRPVSDSRYLLQTEETLYELSGDEIEAVDGQKGTWTISRNGRLAHTHSYRRLLPSGDVEINQSMTIRRESKKLQTRVQWGAAPHELYMYESMLALDVYGHELDYRLEPRLGTENHNVIVKLAVPVMPGEDTEIMIRTVRRDAATLENGVWTYTHWGNYAEDRLQELKVELPAGAEVLSVNPLVRVVEHDGKSLVFWRRYYPKGTAFPLTVTYKLD